MTVGVGAGQHALVDDLVVRSGPEARWERHVFERHPDERFARLSGKGAQHCDAKNAEVGRATL